MSRLFEEVRACLTMRQVAEHYGYKPNKANMIHSPFNPNDKNPSCKLYEKTFYDYSTGTGGDLIKFVALLLKIDNWKATHELINAFNLPFSSSNYIENRAEIEKRLESQRQAVEREKKFKKNIVRAIENEINMEKYYTRLKEVFEPFSVGWCMAVNGLQSIQYKLDILTFGSRQEQEQLLEERRAS